MASNVIKTGRPMRVPQPSASPDFVLGSRPSALRAPAIPRIKPEISPDRNYGKQATPPTGGLSMLKAPRG